MYDIGQGIPQDYAAAVGWYRKAADQGNAAAQSNLGLMYAIGQGIPQDYVSAHMWFNLAAATGNKDAAKNRDKVAAKMTPAHIAETQRLAREWKPKTNRRQVANPFPRRKRFRKRRAVVRCAGASPQRLPLRPGSGSPRNNRGLP
jgi:TPR repeat protein